MSHSRPTRIRVAAAAGSLALVFSLVGMPAVMAQDDGPAATIKGLAAAIEAKDFESLPTFFCAEFADQAGGLDFASITEGMPPGMDASTLLDAFIFDVNLESIDVLSQTDTEAVVSIVGSISMDINPDALGPFVEALLAASGQDVTPDNVDLFSSMMLSEFQSESSDISDDITLVPGEAMAWVVCDELGGGTAGAPADASAVPADAPAASAVPADAATGAEGE